MSTFLSLSHLTLHSLPFLSFSILLIYHSFGLQQPLCHNDDRSSLLQFKNSFVFDKFSCDPSADYTKLDSWKVGDDCCSWDGVKCDDETGHVIGLDLSSSCLYGSINTSSPLFRLVHLTSLNLSYNNFNLSRIPSGIRSLSQLTHLNLTFSNFTGQIPSKILELSNLVSLDLSLNPLMLQKPGLKDVVETFGHLVNLHLIDVTISSPVPHSLSNLTSLSSLHLQNCSLLGEFPSSIFRLPNLHLLNLGNNPNLTGYLPEFDRVGSPLKVLILDKTNFSGKIPVSIGNLKSLSIFSIRLCCFVGLIPSSIGNLTKLNILDLSDNYFYGNIPSSFQNLTQLVQLWLLSNQLGGGIPPWVGNLTQLTKLFLSNNELQGPIPDSIFRLPNIEVIELVSNKLSGTLEIDSFLQLKYLVYLALSDNQLTLVSSSTYNNATLPKFKILALSGCNLSEFPALLRDQHELEVLDIERNNIKGYVPDWLFTLERLNFLNLGFNSLTGFEHPPNVTLPWTNLNALSFTFNQFEGPLPLPPSSISTYDVSQNKFSGDVSPLFCNLTSLLILDLSNNNLSGNLPPCLSNLGSSALVLNLRNNSLSGKILDNFTSGCALKVLDFSQNEIDGKVPRSLANCSQLEILSMEGNQMTDVFPSWLGILPRLRILSLRSNKLHGAIEEPLSKFEFNRLHIIDLSNNNFAGKLPLKYFQNWDSMKSVRNGHLSYMEASTKFYVNGVLWVFRNPYFITIVNKGTERAYDKILEFLVVVDFSNNKFEGEIPKVIGTLTAVQSLNLSNNILTGHIPLSLGNLKDLEALDLSLNQLSGDIPLQLTLLTFLSIFNVSHNNLVGPIPQGKQFDTFENNSFSSNPGLCGHPLSKICESTNGTLPLPPSEDEDEDSLFEFNWQIVLIGCGSGLVIGVAFGCALDTRKYEWLVKKKFARRRRRRRN